VKSSLVSPQKCATGARKALDSLEQNRNIVPIAGMTGGRYGFSTSYPRPVNMAFDSREGRIAMLALFLIAFVALSALTVLGVLADSGLRWWSAFGQLRRDMAQTAIAAPLPVLRPNGAVSEFSGFERGGNRLANRVSISRAA
jgi:hypothetical protein